MLLERIAGSVTARLLGLPLAPAVTYLTRILADEKAFEFTKEELREVYEPALAPASYDHVIEHLRLSKTDFIRYYQSAKLQNSITLQQHIQDLFDTRLMDWSFNLPTPELRSRFISDFMQTYERYVLSADTTLALLHLLEATTDVRQLLRSITSALGIAANAGPEQTSIIDDVVMTLSISGIPFHILERGTHHLDLILDEERAITPIKIYLQVIQGTPTFREIDAFVERAQNVPQIVQKLTVLPNDVPTDLRDYASRRGVTLMNFSDFRQRVLHEDYRYAVVIGKHGATRLAEGLNVHEFYIPPDAVPILPTGEQKSVIVGRDGSAVEQRIPLAEHVEQFLNTDAARLLVVLGDYGTGKSAWCARTTKELSHSDDAYLPVFISLRHLRSADDLSRITSRAVRVARSHSNDSKRIIVFADGLDEMPSALTPNERRTNVLRLLEVCQIPDKMIVTARTSYFRGLEDFWELFASSNQTTLWDRMARFIPHDKSRPGLRAVMLYPFNNDQIDRYVTEFGIYHLDDPSFAESFLAELRSFDPYDFYRRLARNPLYLFLLVNTRPWLDPTVSSISEVVQLLIKYWLERDIEKGSSRWLLTAADRREFMASLALHMHSNNAVSITFEEFDSFVSEFYEIEDFVHDGKTLALDLQTTGMFGSSGGVLFFALPAAMDLLIAERLDSAILGGDLAGLPTQNQARMWLGLIETGKAGPRNRMEGGRAYQRQYIAHLSAWMSKHGIPFEADREYRVNADPAGIMYLRDKKEWNWPTTNVKPKLFVCLVNYVLNPPLPDDPNVIRARIGNTWGLHARPSARVVRAYFDWRGKLPGASRPNIILRCKGREIPAHSIMGVMSVCAEYGTLMQVVYENCTVEQAEEYMHSAGFQRIISADADWELVEED